MGVGGVGGGGSEEISCVSKLVKICPGFATVLIKIVGTRGEVMANFTTA